MVIDSEQFFGHIESLVDKICFYYQGNSYSFVWLADYAKRTASWLKQQEYRSIAFAIDNSPLNALLYLGSWWQGNDCCPINPRLKPYEIQQILDRVDVDCLIIKAEQLTSEIRDYCSNKAIDVYCVDAYFEHSDCFKSLSSYQPQQKCGLGQGITSHISSGSEDVYKIHRHSAKQIYQYAFDRQYDMGFIDSDFFLIALSINHAYAFSYQLLPALAMGICCVLLPGYELDSVINAMNKFTITSTALLSVMYHQLCAGQDQLQCDSWRWPLVAGDYLTESLATEFKQQFGFELRNGLGMTEVYGYAQNIVDTVSYNRLQLFEQISADIDTFSPPLLFGQQEIGEIVLNGDMLPLDDQSNLKTGDLGYVDESNRLTICGRKKDLIIKGGSNISPLELEEVLLNMPQINEVMVIGINDKVWGEKIVVVVSLYEGTSLNKEILNGFLTQYLADYKLADDLIIVKDLPKNVTGKLDRKVVKRKMTGS